VSPVEACRGCSRLYPYLPRGLCSDCLDRRERDFQAVKEWLRENPRSSMHAVAEATDVDEALIAQFVREGRLELVGSGPSAQELREEEERRARLVRQIAANPTLGTSVAADDEPEARRAGMRARRP
jgi:hypothetical protein